MRRLVLWLPIALLAAVGAWLGSRGVRGPEGLSVLVTIVDAAGRPVPRAQARARFVDGGWVDADAEGHARVHPVPLAADASPDSPQAIADAIEVRAPWYELPPGGALAIERGDANRFLARATLEPHGVLELVVKTTLLGPARARIEADEPLQRIAAIGGQGVARAGVAAAFRIRPGLRTVTVVLEPEPSLSRDRPVARRRLVVDAPAPGELRRVEIEPEASHLIHGRIHWPDALPNALRVGRVQVVELSRDGGTRTVWGHVDVDASGVFAVGEAAALPYELTLEAPFLETPPVLLVGGGGLAEFDSLVARPWLHLTHPDLPGTSRPWRVRLLDAAGEVVGAAGPLRIAPGDGALPLVAARDDLVVEVAVPGANDAGPAFARARVGPIASTGPTAVALALAPSGAGGISLTGAWPRGATVVLHGPAGPWARSRSTTWLPRTPPMPFVARGLEVGRWSVRVLPRDGDLAWECVDVDVVADEVRNVAFTPRPGGRLAIDESFAPGDPRDGTLRVSAADGPHETDVEIPLERRAQGRGWEAPFALRPGTWRGTLALDPSDDAVAGVTFEIVGGETTRVAGDAISPRAGAAPR